MVRANELHRCYSIDTTTFGGANGLAVPRYRGLSSALHADDLLHKVNGTP